MSRESSISWSVFFYVGWCHRPHDRAYSLHSITAISPPDYSTQTAQQSGSPKSEFGMAVTSSRSASMRLQYAGEGQEQRSTVTNTSFKFLPSLSSPSPTAP
jgi:hypothetical protein